jgi:hypothetical protein
MHLVPNMTLLKAIPTVTVLMFKKLVVMQLVHSGELKMVYLEHTVFSTVLLLF